MVGNLEAQEFMNGTKCIRILSGNADARAIFCGFQLVFDRLAQTLHRLRAWRVLLMNEHRGGKVAGREHRDDVPEVRADLVPAGYIRRVFSFRFDRSAIRVEPEMVRGLFMGKAHHFIPALHYALMMLVLALVMLVLR